MTSISLGIANKIFEKYHIRFDRHEVAGYTATRELKTLHAVMLWECVVLVIDTWFRPVA